MIQNEVQAPDLEPVPVPECVICNAAHNGRTSSRARGDAAGIQKYSGIISAHPHRAATDSTTMQELRLKVSEANHRRRL
ncbi:MULTISPECIES: hypothetical protein [unclassified Streptomyces]|uniref:hypothetical protein n=1 Tax=Streptomyces sp. NPDC056835 TaxID=3345956 RepID=UPI0036A6025D